MARAEAISADGTFRTAPTLWRQLFIICCQVSPDVWIPCGFGLLKDKMYESYYDFFNLMKMSLTEIGEELSANFMMADFEKGIRKAAKDVFGPEMDIKGILNPIINHL